MSWPSRSDYTLSAGRCLRCIQLESFRTSSFAYYWISYSLHATRSSLWIPMALLAMDNRKPHLLLPLGPSRWLFTTLSIRGGTASSSTSTRYSPHHDKATFRTSLRVRPGIFNNGDGIYEAVQSEVIHCAEHYPLFDAQGTPWESGARRGAWRML
jgi:hypothetical protein